VICVSIARKLCIALRCLARATVLLLFAVCVVIRPDVSMPALVGLNYFRNFRAEAQGTYDLFNKGVLGPGQRSLAGQFSVRGSYHALVPKSCAGPALPSSENE
jgi:hypothetical protein